MFKLNLISTTAGIKIYIYSKNCVKRLLSKRPKIDFKTNYRLMQVKSNAECSNSALILTFIKLLLVVKISVFFSILEWPFYTGFTVHPHSLAAYILDTFVTSKLKILFSLYI